MEVDRLRLPHEHPSFTSKELMNDSLDRIRAMLEASSGG
jgi:hypothetical protein